MELDCFNCGLCCFWGEDNVGNEKLGEYGIIVGEDGWCIYYDKVKMCTIYNKKPKTCNDFEVGGGGCLLLRKVRGKQNIVKI